MKTQGILILYVCLCGFPAASIFAQDHRADSKGLYLQCTRTFHTVGEFNRLTKGKVKLHRGAWCRKCSGDVRANADDLLIGSSFGVALQLPGQKPTPYVLLTWAPDNPVTTLAAKFRGDVWIGTKQGLHRYEEPRHRNGPPSITYFSGKRWLPDDHVTGIGFENDGDVIWIETPKGFSRIEYKEMTLAEKSKDFIERVRARHVRHGLTADSILQTPGDLSTNQTVSSDNDGLWTQMYVAAEVFRYKVTGEADARANARQGFEAMLRLEEITGIPGFHARSFIKVGEDIQPQDGEWHDTPDGKWRWKGDTSSDEIVGHYFGYAVYYDLVADEAEKQKIRAVITRMTDHILNK